MVQWFIAVMTFSGHRTAVVVVENNKANKLSNYLENWVSNTQARTRFGLISRPMSLEIPPVEMLGKGLATTARRGRVKKRKQVLTV